jgi:hypothetical protein
MSRFDWEGARRRDMVRNARHLPSDNSPSRQGGLGWLEQARARRIAERHADWSDFAGSVLEQIRNGQAVSQRQVSALLKLDAQHDGHHAESAGGVADDQARVRSIAQKYSEREPFCASIVEQVQKGRPITPKQRKVLLKIDAQARRATGKRSRTGAMACSGVTTVGPVPLGVGPRHGVSIRPAAAAWRLPCSGRLLTCSPPVPVSAFAVGGRSAHLTASRKGVHLHD